MKKPIAILLLLALVLGLCACNPAGTANSTGAGDTTAPAVNITGVFSVGFGRVNITPSYSVPLAGYGNTSKRMSTGFYDYIYTTCIAMTDAEGETILLYHNDLTASYNNAMATLKNAISAGTGIPVDHIMISATHMHSGPDLSNSSEPSISTYTVDLAAWMTEAAQTALADRVPAEMYINSTEVLGVNFVRHYTMSDGSVAGDNFGTTAGLTYTGHVSEADHTLQLVKFVREGAQDVVLGNWQAHPHGGGGSKNYNITSDSVGAMRDKLESETGCLFAYFTGASGNVNSSSRIKEENAASDYIGRGQILAQAAIDVYDRFTKVETGNMELVSTSYTGLVNHEDDWKLSYAKQVQQVWVATNNAAQALAVLPDNVEIKSPYHANGIINKATMGKTFTMENINAFSIGDVAFVTAPYEMFHENGSAIKERSPYEMTFVITLANGGNGYLPSYATYEFFSYECCTSRFKQGSAEELVDLYVSLLNQIHAK
ncbi:MAG: hypothetical protein J6L24_04675 [Oscillospiraceae bacterium]|nr:hypothetical protein [Oscillospiraceae bacterium]